MKLRKKESCSHDSTTLVQCTFLLEGTEKESWFAAFQCDSCGAITRKEVTPSDLEDALNLPWLDEDFYESRAMERLEIETEWTALQFMNRAVRR